MNHDGLCICTIERQITPETKLGCAVRSARCVCVFFFLPLGGTFYLCKTRSSASSVVYVHIEKHTFSWGRGRHGIRHLAICRADHIYHFNVLGIRGQPKGRPGRVDARAQHLRLVPCIESDGRVTVFVMGVALSLLFADVKSSAVALAKRDARRAASWISQGPRRAHYQRSGALGHRANGPFGGFVLSRGGCPVKFESLLRGKCPDWSVVNTTPRVCTDKMELAYVMILLLQYFKELPRKRTTMKIIFSSEIGA